MEDFKEETLWLKEHLVSEIIEAESDMDIMEYTLEEIYDERLDKELDYYKGNHRLLNYIHNETIMELDMMEFEYKEKEEYEKCAVITRVKDKLIKKYNMVKPKTGKVV